MSATPVQAIVTDIEGTTSSLSFVKDVLFPYARMRLPGFVHEQRHVPEVAALLDEVRRQVEAPLDDQGVVEQLLRWIDEDRKVTPLKALQGLIWEAGYRDGDFTGHLYADAWQNLTRWHDAGIALYVFSSGSIHAQKLLFGHTEYGDLTPLFSGYFDTTIGAKQEAAAYTAIAGEIGLPPEAILFLSDIRQELDAARAAGMQTTWLVRESKLDPAAAHVQVSSFNSILR